MRFSCLFAAAMLLAFAPNAVGIETWAKQSPVNVKDFGAACDGRTVADAITVAGSNVLTSATARFTAKDVGKILRVVARNTVTISIASPSVISWTNHGLAANAVVTFSTTGALPTGLAVGKNYYVVGSSITTNSFEVSINPNGSAIDTRGSQTGTQSLTAQTALSTKIVGFTNSTTVKIAANAVSSVNGATFYYGHDDSAAMQKAFNAGGVVLLPAGLCLTSASLNTANASIISGEGIGKTIIQGDIAHHIFAITGAAPVLFQGFTAIFAPIISNSGIAAFDFDSGGRIVNSQSVVQNVQAWGDYCYIFSQGNAFNIHRTSCYFNTAAIFVANSVNPDEGNSVVDDNYFMGWNTGNNLSMCVQWVSSGGVRFSGNSCLNMAQGFRIQASSSIVLTGQLLIENNFFDLVGNSAAAGETRGFYATRTAPALLAEVEFSGNTCNGNWKCIEIPTDSTGAWISTFSANNNTVYGGAAVNGTIFDIDSVNSFIAQGNNIQSVIASTKAFNVGSQVTSCKIGPNGLTGIFVEDTLGFVCSRWGYTGAWTPVMRGSSVAGKPTYARQAGFYEINGKTVTAQFTITITAIGGMTGHLQIGGLPITSASTADDSASCWFSKFSGWTGNAGYTWLAGTIAPSSNIAELVENGSGKNVASSSISEFAASTTLSGTCVYHL